MKRRLVVLSVILVLSVLLAGCNSSNKLKVGTSADYPPYEYVDETGKMTGFDVELMNEIGKRMGVELEWVDMPFDSLIAAVQEGKIDLSIACFNYSAERDLEVDFSDAYYTSEDAFIAGAGFSGTFAKPEDAANYIVGVQSGTVQDDWLTSNLVDAGLMDADNLKRYERVDQAALDLNAGRIDIMMADYVPAKAILKQYTGFQVLYNGELSTGPLNIVLKDGDSELQGKINKIIKELLAEGFIDELAVKYFTD